MDDVYIVSASWLLWLMLLWILMYNFLCRHMFSIFLGLNQSWITGLNITVSLTSWGAIKLFFKVTVLFTVPPPMHQPSNFFTFLSTRVITHFYFRPPRVWKPTPYFYSMISILLKLLRHALGQRLWSPLVNVPHELEKSMRSDIHEAVCKYQLYPVDLQCFWVQLCPYLFSAHCICPFVTEECWSLQL